MNTPCTIYSNGSSLIFLGRQLDGVGRGSRNGGGSGGGSNSSSDLVRHFAELDIHSHVLCYISLLICSHIADVHSPLLIHRLASNCTTPPVAAAVAATTTAAAKVQRRRRR